VAGDSDTGARDRLLDAAGVCFERYGVRKTTVDDVAREAGVSRATVYRHFGGRGGLIVAAYLREATATRERLRRLMDGPGPFAERLLEATVRSIESIRSGPHRELMLSGDGVLASRALAASSVVYDTSRETMAPYFDAAKAAGELRPELELDDLNEWMLRIVLSFATVAGPRPADRERIHSLLAAFLAPAIGPARH
jgi:AcrR family transcriptional regulator